MENIKHIAKKIKTKYNLYAPSARQLMHIIRDMGYTVVTFGTVYNPDSVKELIAALGVSAETSRYKAFTYITALYLSWISFLMKKHAFCLRTKSDI